MCIRDRANAYLAFHEDKYDKVTNLLIDFKSSLPFLNIQARTLTTRAYFEAFMIDDSYYDMFLANLEAFNKYLYRSKELTQHKIKSFQNYIYFLRQLGKFQIENRGSENALNQLLVEIKNTQPINASSWFINRIDKMVQSSKHSY